MAKTKEEKAAYQKEYRAKNRDKINAAQRKRFALNKGHKTEEQKNKRKEYKKGHYLKNKTKIDLRNKAYAKSHKEEINLSKKEYYIKKKDSILDKQKKYADINKEAIAIYKSNYYNTNKAKILQYQKEYVKNNEAKVKEYQKNYTINRSDEQKEKCNKAKETYRKNNMPLITKRAKEKLLTDPNTKIKSLLRSRIKHAIKRGFKSGSAVKELGCSIDVCREYIESQFTEGMSWENHGRYGWHIDHKKALALFNLQDKKEFMEACHYTNLQPMWWRENLSKGKKTIEEITDAHT